MTNVGVFFVFVFFKTNVFAHSSRGNTSASEVQSSYLGVALKKGITMRGKGKHPRWRFTHLDESKSPPIDC